MDAIECIEVSFRTQWAYHLSHKYGPHAYFVDSKGLRKESHWLRDNIRDLKEHLNRSDEIYIAHYKKTYEEELPPAWVSCEVMSLGLLSRWYSNLKAFPARTAIANAYQLDQAVLEGVMEHLSYIRNLCARHSRLWNRRLTKTMALPKLDVNAVHDGYFSVDKKKDRVVALVDTKCSTRKDDETYKLIMRDKK